MKHIETIGKIKIYSTNDKKNPYSTVLEVGGFMGVIETVHKTLEAARQFAEKDTATRNRLKSL